MPKISLTYEGATYEIILSPESAGKKEIQAALQIKWGLIEGQYELTYIDMDGDTISAQVQEDFQVANVTMIEDGNDKLQYTLTLKGTVKPQIQEVKLEEIIPKLEQPAQIAKQYIVESEDEKNDDEKQIKIAEQEANTKEEKSHLEQKSVKQDQAQGQDIPTMIQEIQALKQDTEQKMIENREEKKQIIKQIENQRSFINEDEVQAEDNIKSKTEIDFTEKQNEQQKEQKSQKIQEPTLSDKIKKQSEQKQRKRIQQREKQRLKKEAQQAKRQAAKQARAKQIEILKEKKEKQKKAEELKKKMKLEGQKVGNFVFSPPKQEEKHENSCQADLKRLIREEVFKMIPELRQKMFSSQKLDQRSKKQEKNGEYLSQECQRCHSRLSIPCYYDSMNELFLCSSCESQDEGKNPLLKIRSEQILKKSIYVSICSFLPKGIKNTEEEYIVEVRNEVQGQIRQQFNKKIIQMRKKKQVQAKKKPVKKQISSEKEKSQEI